MRFLVLQPQSELAFFRAFLRENDFRIAEEDMVLEDGKYYPVILAKASEKPLTKKKETQEELSLSGLDNPAYVQSLEDEFGPCLIRKKQEVLMSYLNFWEKHQKQILENVRLHNKERTAQVEEELRRIQDTRDLMTKNF